MKRTGEQNKPGQEKRFAPSGFFVLRTPLLAFDELLAWGDGLEAPAALPAALEDPARLAEALERDRRRLRDRLAAVFSRPALREALFIAAPELEELFDLWVREPQNKRVERVELALARYFQRMAGRATPFGLFAGCAVGTISDETRLVTGSQAECRRHTRLDMDYLSALAEMVGSDESVRNNFIYYPNSSLYRAIGRVRYVESRLNGNHRTSHLVAADDSDYLADTLARAKDGATAAQLAAALAEDGFPLDEAEEYLDQLIENQVLVPDLALPATGAEPIHPLINQLSEYTATAPIADRLAQTRAELAAIDASGLGVEPARYRALAKNLENLPAKVELSKLFQVDLVKSAPEATLGGAVLAEINRGVETLHRLFGRLFASDLDSFSAAFAARYEGREMPLVEVLDEEIGIGFPPGGAAGDEASPLLKGIAFPGAPQEMAYWSARDVLMLRKLTQALERQAQEIHLEPSDLELAGSKELPPLPDAFAVLTIVEAADEASLSAGDFRVIVKAVFGPSGAPILGRFCHADDALREQVELHLRAEEALQPEAIFAEIVHLPEGRLGNILLRPVLRDYEIPYMGRSGAPPERQIPVTDLLVSVRHGRIHLRSERLGREVIPRLTNAHAFNSASSGMYRFLGTLQFQGMAAALGWDWGVLGAAPFLPRVVMGRLVLSPARWRVGQDEIQRLSSARGAARFQALQQWRAERRLPRWVALADGDQLLSIDLDNWLSIETFIQLIKQRHEAIVTELFPEPDRLCARGPEGRFVHEIVIPYVKSADQSIEDCGLRIADWKKEHDAVNSSLAMANPQSAIRNSQSENPQSIRRFPTGSEWLYVKLYTGATVADQVLREVVQPLTEELLQSGAVESWFFIRYADPEWHLRLRFRGAPERLHDEALPALQAAAAPFLEDGRLWRMQLDTYEREVERYGGEAGFPLSEQLFHADSEAALEILDLLEQGDAGLDERWRLTLRGMDFLLDDFGFDLKTKRGLLERIRKGFAKEFRADEQFIGFLGDRFRKERKDLDALLDPNYDSENPLRPGIEVFRRRSHCWASTIAELKACAQDGRLSVSLTDLAASHMHMHANRLLRSAQRMQELVIYDYLARLYESRLARASVQKARAGAFLIPA